MCLDHLSGGGALSRPLSASIGRASRQPVPPRKSAAKKTEAGPGITLLPIRCVACGTWSVLELPGASPWPGAVFQKKDWTVLNEPEDGHVVFACGKCFEAEMNKPGSRIHGEG